MDSFSFDQSPAEQFPPQEGPMIQEPPKKAPSPGRTEIFFSVLGFLAVALIVGGILYSFMYPEYEQDQLRKTGLPAKGTIISIDDTGNRYNDQPQVKIHLQVQPEGKPKYETDVTMIISPVYLPQFQPGQTVDVKYDAKDPSKVALD